MAKSKLSARQENMLDFITNFISQHSYPPTIREIGKACHITSTSVVNYNLNKLENEGYINRMMRVSRGIQLDKNKASRLVKNHKKITKTPKTVSYTHLTLPTKA